ncbi:bifunctional diguanylate cyclase/phosphodiesterase [Stappia sp. ES.058]|uniref:putative bifunctional diguanylate cyclase/phosphodiesterase n=1 Tax=Stappia sp. ES.058 TaxID=1881061 RepID=UPI00087BD53C|nr:bifunctional diguanylate cyclase/phosphodiesterase [Stappia sp. ES.058]SDU27253.1 diguanylate cyclase (GGDEF) domain-containing protein [Stappia sp. ES.058]
MKDVRNFRKLAGVFAGFMIVVAFAGAIHGANLWFSHSLYARDAMDAARRFDRELQDYIKTAGGSQAEESAASTGLRSSIDTWDTTAAGDAKPYFAPAKLEFLIDEFIRHLHTHDDMQVESLVWFGSGGARDALDHRREGALPLGVTGSETTPAPNIVPLLKETLATRTPAISIADNLIGPPSDPSLIALPILNGPNVAGALVLVHDQARTGVFLTEFLRLGLAIMIALCATAMLLASFFVWVRFRDRLKDSQTIQFLAHHDALTSLPNRTVFATKLNEALRLAHAKATNIAVMLIDVDKFKQINDTHGHAVGDLFLQVIADRLRSVFGNHVVARLSGDEFAVLIAVDTDRKALTRLAATMIEATRTPTRISGKDLQISLSIGVAQAREATWRASRLLHCADLALYRAKHSGRSTFKWYSPDMDAEAQQRKELEGDLRKALKQDEFRLLYQPQFTLSDLRLCGYETLLRWEHPEKGTISPTVFIPIAEEAGLIEEIGSWVLQRACMEAAAWTDSSLTIAVNVSPAQFSPGKTEDRVALALEASGLDPGRLEIEITESLLISDTEAVVKTLTHVREMGVSIAMDDFGTGFSSLSYLSRFPFDTIKIDRSFVATLGKSRTTDAVVASIVGLGRSLGVIITAEGIENEHQVTLLRATGCDKVQGFLFGRPMDLTENDPATAQARRPEQETVSGTLLELELELEDDEREMADQDTRPVTTQVA